MLTFLIVFFPLVLATYFSQKSSRIYFRSTLVGLSLGACISAFNVLFGSTYRLYHAGFWNSFTYLFMREFFFPLAFLSVILFFLSKDTLSFKVHALFSYFSSFYVFYLPFRVLFRSSELTFFNLIAKPILFFFLLLTCCSCVTLLYREMTKTIKRKPFIALYSVLLVFFLVFPSCIEALRYGDTSLLWILFAVLYCALCVCFVLWGLKSDGGVQDYTVVPEAN